MALSGALAACTESSTTGGDGPRVAFTHPAAQSGIVAVLTAYATAEMKELGGVFTVGALPNATPDAQFNLIEGWISQKYDVIEVFPLDPVSLAPLQKRAQDAGIKWVTYLTPMDGDDGTIGPSPTEQGQLLADGVTQWLQQTGLGSKALVLSYSPMVASVPRVQLAADALKRFPAIQVVSTQDTVDPASALEITENTLRAHPDLDMVLCLTDDAAVGATMAFKNAGKDPSKCFIGGCDGTEDALKNLLADSAYKASAAINVREFGHSLADQAVRLFKDGTAITPTPAVLLTKGDRAETERYLAQFAEA